MSVRRAVVLAGLCVFSGLRGIPLVSAQETKRPLPDLLAELKKSTPPDPKLAAELAQYGAAAVPELVKLAAEVGYVTTGMMERIQVNPFIPHARAVIDAVADPAAVPALKGIMFDPHLGSAARKKLLELKAPYSGAEVVAIVAHDKKSHTVEDRMIDEYPRLFLALTPDDQAKLLMDFLRPGQEILFFNLDKGKDLHNAKPQDIQFVRDTLALLAKTGSPAAKQLLERQAASLAKAADASRAELASANDVSFDTEADRQNLKKAAETIDALLVDYKNSIAELAKPKP